MPTKVQASHQQLGKTQTLVILLIWGLIGLPAFNTSKAQSTMSRSVAEAPVKYQSYLSGLNISEENLFKLTKRISVKFNRASIEHVLTYITDEADLTLSYSPISPSLKHKISLEAKDLTVLEALFEAIKNTDLTFKLSAFGQLIVAQSGAPAKQDLVSEPASMHLVTGIVTSGEDGTRLPGVNILVKGSVVGTTTNENGEFSFDTPTPNDTLIFLYVGYLSQEIALNGRGDLSIVMQVDQLQFDEVVVVGYGTNSQYEVNGAISNVGSEQIENYATSNFEQALLGTMAGVQITQTGRNPGEDSQITIRGIRTITAGVNPLLVVDGVPLTEGSSLSSINAQDIESISVLKDAASAAIYGSRASNGVLLITTKKGERGKLKVTFDTYIGTQSRTDELEMAGAYDAAIFLDDARDNGYVSRDPANRNVSDDNETRLANGANRRELNLSYLEPYLAGTPGLTDFDWTNAIFRETHQNNYYLSLSGSSAQTDYFFSLGYLDQGGITIGTAMDRYTANLRINTVLNDKFTIGANVNTSFANLDVTDDNGWNSLPADPGSTFGLIYPFFEPYNEDGSFAISEQLRASIPEDAALVENPIAMTLLSKNTEDRFRTFGNTFLAFTPVQGLQLKTVLGGDFRSDFLDYYQPSTFGTYRTLVENNQSNSSETDVRIENVIIENTATYEKDFNDHSFEVLVGQSYQQEEFFRSRIAATGIVDDNLDNIAAGSSFSVDSDRSKWTQLSYLGRLQYDFANKYFVSAALRRDGSSRFGADSRWASFPALSAGWLISNESFFPKNQFLTFLKLRASWGETGNNQIGAYSSQALVTQDNYTFGGQLVPGFAISTSPNPALSWEKNTSSNVGLDFGLLDSRLLLGVEYYVSTTSDLLLNVPVPRQSGFRSSLQNIGELENRGFEFELAGSGFNLGEVIIDFNANLTTNSNKVLALGPDQDQIINGEFLTRVGEPLAQFYGYDVIGVYKSQEEIDSTPHLSGTLVGDYIVRDTNGDGTVNADDRITHGTFDPDFYYGFGANFSYKNFDLNLSFTGVEGRLVYDWWSAVITEVGEGFALPSQYYVDNYYHPTRNPEGFFATPNFGNFSSARRATRVSNRNLQDGDYFRLRSLQLGYTLPQPLLSRMGVSRLRVYVTANNLFTITKYRGLNSDAARTSPLRRGYIRSAAPVPKLIAGGITVSF